MQKVFLWIVITLNVIILSVLMLNVIILSDAGPGTALS
jgi:hypothetical protein